MNFIIVTNRFRYVVFALLVLIGLVFMGDSISAQCSDCEKSCGMTWDDDSSYCGPSTWTSACCSNGTCGGFWQTLISGYCTDGSIKTNCKNITPDLYVDCTDGSLHSGSGSPSIVGHRTYSEGSGCTGGQRCQCSVASYGSKCSGGGGGTDCTNGLPAPACGVCKVAVCDINNKLWFCGNLPNNTPCDDGKFCTAGDQCASGFCVGATTPCGLSSAICSACIGGGDACKKCGCDETTDSCTCDTIDYCSGAGSNDGCCPSFCNSSNDGDCGIPPENCTNNIDDNGNGLIDCQDPVCPAACGVCQVGTCSNVTYDWTCSNVGCINGDGCCTAGCNFLTDNDCAPPAENCTNNVDDNGNGLVDCQDPLCPSDCGACKTGSCSGFPSYDWVCTNFGCINNDSCCVGACTFLNDNDCPVPLEICDNNIDDNGNGLIDCQDPACPAPACAECKMPVCSASNYDWGCQNEPNGTACSDGDACTTDSCQTGVCQGTAIVACVNNDNCCPAGCNPGNDSDCSNKACSLRNLNCPLTAVAGANVNLSYEFLPTNAAEPYEVRSVYGPQDGLWGSLNLNQKLWCSKDTNPNQDFNGSWRPETRTVLFPNNATIGTNYAFDIKCEGVANMAASTCTNDANILTCNVRAANACTPACPAPNTYCAGAEPDNGCGNTCPPGTKNDCPAPNTYCPGNEPTNSCGVKCPVGTKLPNCPNPNTYCPGSEPSDGCGGTCPLGTKDCRPAAPVPTVVSHTTNTIRYQWPAVAGADTYSAILYDASWNLITSVNVGNVLTWTANGLNPNTRYIFYARATNTYGSRDSAPLWSATSIETPTGIVATNRTINSITIKANGTFTNLAVPQSGIRFKETVTGNIRNYNSLNSWLLNGLTPDTAYTFLAQARNQDALNNGTGDYSIENWSTIIRTCKICPLANTYCAGAEPDNGCGNTCPPGTKNDCPNTNTYCPGSEPVNSCGVACPLGTKDCTPAKPQNLRAITHTTNSMRWTWDAASGATSYVATVYDAAWNLVTSVNIGNVLNWTANGLSPNQRYTIFITASNTYGNKPSDPLASATSIETPISITCLNATADTITVRADGVFTNLNIPSSGIRFRSGAQIRNYANNNVWTLSGLTPSANYTFLAQARNQDALNDGTPDYSVENWQRVCRTFGCPEARNLGYNPGDYCLAPLKPIFTWNFFDPDAGHTQSAYQVQIATNAAFNNIVSDSNKVMSNSNSYSPVVPLPSYNNNYHWRVKVWDNVDAVCNFQVGAMFQTPKHAYPKPDFTLAPPIPAKNEPTQFCSTQEGVICPVDVAKCYNNAQNEISCTGQVFTWNYPAGATYIVGDNSSENPLVKFDSMGNKIVSLTIRDTSINQSCTITKNSRVIPMPIYRER